MRKKLTLNSESIRLLTSTDLTAAVGGGTIPMTQDVRCPPSHAAKGCDATRGCSVACITERCSYEC